MTAMSATTSTPAQLILGSSSKYRAQLLRQLRVPFSQQSPDIDETPHLHETPLQLAQRLSVEKATVIAQRFPEAFVIGADQVVDLNGTALGKPGGYEAAVLQLQQMRGQTLLFHTAVCCARLSNGELKTVQDCVTIAVKYRNFSDETLHRYLTLEQPFDCAGSCKSEGLGITLLEEIRSTDPSSLIGLPLIATVNLLRQLGYNTLDYAA